MHQELPGDGSGLMGGCVWDNVRGCGAGGGH